MVAWFYAALIPVSSLPIFLFPLTSNFPRGQKKYMTSAGVGMASDMDSYFVNLNLVIMSLFQVFYIHNLFPKFITFAWSKKDEQFRGKEMAQLVKHLPGKPRDLNLNF